MKRYIPSSCNWMEDGVMLERKNGNYVGYEDMLEMLTNFVSNIQIIDIRNPRTYAEYIIKEYGKDFIR